MTAQGLTTITKADLIDEVSRLAELTRKDSEVIVETIFESVVRSLRAGSISASKIRSNGLRVRWAKEAAVMARGKPLCVPNQARSRCTLFLSFR